MIECVRKALARMLRETADKVDAGTTDIDEEQTIEIMKIVAHQPMSKESAALYLNMSTSRFDTLVRDGYLPKGRKRIGFKEKVWYQDEIDEQLKKYRKH